MFQGSYICKQQLRKDFRDSIFDIFLRFTCFLMKESFEDENSTGTSHHEFYTL